MSNLRVGFAGTPEFAATILKSLCLSSVQPLVVFTQPDRPAGRGRKLQAPPVKSVAQEFGIPVEQPRSFRLEETVRSLQSYDLDVLVVAAYGLILPQVALDIPRIGCINVHASLLPRWRGAAPIERALLAGDSITGVCLMRMEAGLDTGPVYACRSLPITPKSTGQTLEEELAKLGTELLLEQLPSIRTAQPALQSAEGICYATKLSAGEGQIDWLNSADDIERQLRALHPRIPVYTSILAADGPVQLFLIEASASPDGKGPPGTILSAHPKFGLEVACGTGSLFIKRLRLSRGKGLPLSIAEALNGFRSLFTVGRSLGRSEN